jgi:hypothetical protein
VLRRQIARTRCEPADRAWFAALSVLIPRARWSEVFPVTPAILLACRFLAVLCSYVILAGDASEDGSSADAGGVQVDHAISARARAKERVDSRR